MRGWGVACTLPRGGPPLSAKNVIRVDFAAAAALPPDPALAAEVSAAGQALARVLRDLTGKPPRLRVDTASPRAEAVASGPPDLSAAATACVVRWDARRRGGESLADWRARRAGFPRVVRLDVLAPADWLRDTGEARLGDFGRMYANPAFAAVEEAARWLRDRVLPTPDPLAPPALVESWRRVPVSVFGKDGLVCVSLYDAIFAVLGPDYRERLPSAAELVAERGVPEADARTIAEAMAKFGRRVR